MKSFIFVRHGKSHANAKRKIATADTPLIQEGVSQAIRTGKELKDYKIDIIVTSPMLRAQQTAEIIAGELGIPLTNIKIINELQERGFGKLEGGPKTHDSNWYLEADAEELEPREELVKRMKKALDKIADLVKQGKKVLTVGHDVSGNYLLQVAKGKKRFLDFDPLEPLPHEDFLEVKIK